MVKKIIACSDIHIRNLKRMDETFELFGGREKNSENRGDIIDYFEDWLQPHNLKIKEIFEPFSEFALRGGFVPDEEEINQNTADDSEN